MAKCIYPLLHSRIAKFASQVLHLFLSIGSQALFHPIPFYFPSINFSTRKEGSEMLHVTLRGGKVGNQQSDQTLVIVLFPS